MRAFRRMLPALLLILVACSDGGSAASVPCFYYQNPDGTKTARCGDAAAASPATLDVPHRQFRIFGIRPKPHVIVAADGAAYHPRIVVDADASSARTIRGRSASARSITARAGTSSSSSTSRRSFRILARAIKPASASSSSRAGSVTSRSTSSADDDGETILDRIRARRTSTSSSSSSSRSSSSRSRSSRATGTGGTFTFSGERCPRNRSLIGAVFTDAEATCGTDGWTFPVLMNGDCPISACILKVQDSETFGSMNF